MTWIIYDKLLLRCRPTHYFNLDCGCYIGQQQCASGHLEPTMQVGKHWHPVQHSSGLDVPNSNQVLQHQQCQTDHTKLFLSKATGGVRHLSSTAPTLITWFLQWNVTIKALHLSQVLNTPGLKVDLYLIFWTAHSGSWLTDADIKWYHWLFCAVLHNCSVPCQLCDSHHTLGWDVGQAYLEWHCGQLGESGKPSCEDDDRPPHHTYTRPRECLNWRPLWDQQPEASEAHSPCHSSICIYISVCWSVSDMAHILLRNKLPNFSGCPQKLLGLACTPWHTTFLHLGYTCGLLADGHEHSCIPSKPTPWRILSTLPVMIDLLLLVVGHWGSRGEFKRRRITMRRAWTQRVNTMTRTSSTMTRE